MHIKNKWCIIILIWSIICMTKAMLIYSCDIYIYTHIDMWIIYVYACLRGLRLSERSSQNTEPHYDYEWVSAIFLKHASLKSVRPYNRGVTKMIFLFFTLLNFWFSFFAFKLKRQRELVTKTWTVQLSLLFPHFFFFSFLMRIFFRPFLLVFDPYSENEEEQRHGHVLLCLQPPCPAVPLPPLQDESRCDRFLYWVDGSSTTVEQCSVIGSVSSGSSWHWRVPAAPVVQVSSSQKILIVQEFGVLACLPKSVEAEVEVHLNHLFALIGEMRQKKFESLWKQNHFAFREQYIRIFHD